MARSQNGTTSRLRVNVGGCNFVAGLTVAVLANVTGRNLQWRNLMCPLNSGATPQGWSFEIDNGNRLIFSNLSVLGSSTTTIATTDGPALYAATKVAGTTVPRLHRYRFSDGAIFHENAGGSFADGTAPGASGFLDLGGDAGGSGDWFSGDYGPVAGLWNAAMSDSQVEALAFSLAAWFALQPAGLWLMDQDTTAQKVVDLTGGGANESTSTALGISSASFPFGYGAPELLATRQPAGAGPDIRDVVGTVTLNLAAAGDVAKTGASSGGLSLGLAASDGVSKAGAATGAVAVATSTTGTAAKLADALGALALSLGVTGATTTEETHTTTGAVALGLSAAGVPVKTAATVGQVTLAMLVEAVDVKLGQSAGALALAVALGTGGAVKTGQVLGALDVTLAALGDAEALGSDQAVGAVALALGIVAAAVKVAATQGTASVAFGVAGVPAKVTSSAGVASFSTVVSGAVDVTKFVTGGLSFTLAISGGAGQIVGEPQPRRAQGGHITRAQGGTMARGTPGRISRATGGRIR